MLKTSGADGRLPECCFVVIAGLAPGANVAIARRGRRGVEVTSIDFGDGAMARAAVRVVNEANGISCLLYTSPSPRDRTRSRMPSSA